MTLAPRPGFVLALLLSAAALAACGPPKTGLLELRGQGDAMVTIDYQYIGKLGRLPNRQVRLPVGEHRVTVERVGSFPVDVLVVVEQDARQTVDVKLTDIPD